MTDDDQDFAELCRILGATPTGSAVSRFGLTIEVPDVEEAPASLEDLRAFLGDCRRCKLCEGRKTLVFGSGPPRADLMVIGEGPGREEDELGEPFVGPAGQMLDKMLENVLKIPRGRVHVTNVVRCRPKNNRDPEPDEVASCLPFLRMQRDLVAPRAILLLGAVAATACLGLEGGIGRHRGRWHSWDGIACVATFHPAYLLRKPEDKRKVLEDLLMLKAGLDGSGPRSSPA